jgi:RNA polymerase sigma-70 factor (ECF subfamily)
LALTSTIARAAAETSWEERVRRGEPAELRAVYEATRDRLYRFALAMSGDRDLAADALQETFVALLRNPERFDPARGTIEAFLFGILRNRLRVERRETREFDSAGECEETGDDDLLESYERQEQVALVREAVSTLPAPYREALTLCDLEELSYEEAAGLLGTPVGTIRSRLSRARGLLAKKLREAKR